MLRYIIVSLLCQHVHVIGLRSVTMRKNELKLIVQSFYDFVATYVTNRVHYRLLNLTYLIQLHKILPFKAKSKNVTAHFSSKQLLPSGFVNVFRVTRLRDPRMTKKGCKLVFYCLENTTLSAVFS